MGIDGFSMSNLGLTRNMTSSQLATEAEKLARESLDSQISDMDGVNKKDKVGKQDPDAAFNGHIPFIPDEKQKEDEGNEQSEEQSAKLSTEDDDEEEEACGRYHFRYNSANMIEIYDSEKCEVIRTISPEEASNVMLNMTKTPGIFVNKKV